MSDSEKGRARAVADLAEGLVLASVELAAPAKRVFRALSSEEVIRWWVRSGVFDTRKWNGDLREGGRWSASGVAMGNPYSLEGEFTVVEAPRTLAHTWKSVGSPEAPTTVSYRLDEVEGGTRITLHHTGFSLPEICINTAIGWETSFDRLAQLLGSEPK
jgi:uncharacterized protein YndB with AHSA1/START domain